MLSLIARCRAYQRAEQSGVHGIALARTRLEGLIYGSGGNATVPHLATALLRNLSKARLTHLPYRGQAQVMPDIPAGRLTTMSESVPSLQKRGRASA